MAHVLGRRTVAPGGRSRLWLAGGIALAGWLVASVVGIDLAPALARTCGTVTIESGTASPSSGTTATTFAFSVAFIDSTGAAPTSVKLRIAETWTTLAPNGSDYAAGVQFKGSRKLPVGTWSYFFRATYGNGLTCDHVRPTPQTVTVGPVPTPKPAATPKPTPRPTPRPTPKPTPKATARATTSSPSNKPVAQATVAPSSTPSSIVTVGGAGSSAGNADGADNGGGGVGRGFDLGPLVGGSSLAVPLVAALVGVLGGLLLLFARRRSRRDPSPGGGRGVNAGSMALQAATLGPPPMLVPAAIFHQVLFDPAELAPVWLRRRPAPAPRDVSEPAPEVDETAIANAGLTENPKPTKRTKRPKVNGNSSTTRTRTKRVPKPDPDATDRT